MYLGFDLCDIVETPMKDGTAKIEHVPSGLVFIVNSFNELYINQQEARHLLRKALHYEKEEAQSCKDCSD